MEQAAAPISGWDLEFLIVAQGLAWPDVQCRHEGKLKPDISSSHEDARLPGLWEDAPNFDLHCVKNKKTLLSRLNNAMKCEKVNVPKQSPTFARD